MSSFAGQIKTFYNQEGIDLRNDRMALQRLREAAEKAKIELSSTQDTSINLPFITADETGPKHLELQLNRAKFEELAHELIEKTIEPVSQSLKDAELQASEIDRVILVGGSTRIPAVQKAIQNFFQEQMPLDRSVNPDEAVALGAAVQGGILGGEVEDLLLLDVIPLSMGIETLGEVFTKIIERNTTIPTSKAQIFSTAMDGQTSVEIHVLQGERAMARDNKSLGKFLLAGIPIAPRGVPQIDVAFEIDVNGILQVSAIDRGTGREQSLRITNTGGLNQNEIERMRQEAEEYAELDRRRRNLIELKNQADNLIYNYNTTLKEQGHLINQQLKSQIKLQKQDLEAAFDNPTLKIEEVQQKLDGFQAILLEAGSEVYSQANKDSQDKGFDTVYDDNGTVYDDNGTVYDDNGTVYDDNMTVAGNATEINFQQEDDTVGSKQQTDFVGGTEIDDYEAID
jgi:molecular chaperone DnaK